MAFGCKALAGLTAMAVAVSAPAAAAPSTAGDDPGFGDPGLTTVAPVAGRGWKVGATLNTLFDENILRIGDGLPLRAGRTRADFRVSPSVSLSTGLPVGRQQLFVGGELGRDYYARNTQLNRNRFAIGGGANLRVGTRCTGAVGIDYAGRQVLVSEVAELVPNLQKTLTYGGSANCQAPVGIGFGGSIRRVERRNDSLSRRAFDLNSTIFAPQISYALPALGQFSVTGSLNKVRYPQRGVLEPTGDFVNDGVDIMSGRFGYSRALGTRFNISLGVSYLQAKPTPTTIVISLAPPLITDRPTFSGLGYDAAVTYRAGPRLTAVVNASRDVSASSNVGAQYQVRESYGLDLDYALGSAINVGTGVTLNKRDYRGSFTTPDEQLLRDRDSITRVYGQIVYAPVRLYSVSFEVAHQDRNSNPDVFSFASTSAQLRLRVNLGRES